MSKRTMKTFSFVVTVEAANEDLAEEMRDEIAGTAEDNHASGFVDAEATCSPLESGDLTNKLDKYRALHALVSDLIEDGKLEQLKEHDPRGYKKLVSSMTELASLDPEPASPIQPKAISVGP